MKGLELWQEGQHSCGEQENREGEDQAREETAKEKHLRSRMCARGSRSCAGVRKSIRFPLFPWETTNCDILTSEVSQVDTGRNDGFLRSSGVFCQVFNAQLVKDPIRM